jgi:uncharacterized protein YceH (UPF0502 family)
LKAKEKGRRIVMGTLTDDMARLHKEIGVLRGARSAFLAELARGVAAIQRRVSTLLTNFQDAHAEMGKQARTERMAFVGDVRKSVDGLKKTVAGLRRGFAADIQGAHRAWFGKRA